MNILVTGASGGFGKILIPRLIEDKNFRIRALVHRAPSSVKDCESVTGDLNDIGSLEGAARGMDTVVHLAALTHARREEDYTRVNAEGTLNLLQASRRTGIKRFIYVSSGAAHPRGGAYSESKFRAEQYVRESGLSWVILRPREIYGPGFREGIQQLIRWVRKSPFIPVIGTGRYPMSPVFVDDVIAATVAAIGRDDLEGKTFVLGGPEVMSFSELIDRLGRYYGARPVKLFVPAGLVRTTVDFLALFNVNVLTRDQISRLMCDKPVELDSPVGWIDYHPRSLEEGLSRCGD